MSNPFSLPWLALKSRRPRRITSVKAVKDSFWLHRNYDAMMFFGVIVTHTQHDADVINARDSALKRHETIHLLQARSTHNSWLCFYWLYVWYYLRALPLNRRLPRAAYRLNPFELEAYAHMYDAHYVASHQDGACEWRSYARIKPLQRARRLGLLMLLFLSTLLPVFGASPQAAGGIDLTRATLVYHDADTPLARQMACLLADDIERVSGVRPTVATQRGPGANVIIGTVKHTRRHRELQGSWERYAIDTTPGGGDLVITGSDPRGMAYGVLHVSQQIGVSPWYWWADVPVDTTNHRVHHYQENTVSRSPSVKYRGIFLNDEDWGLLTWAARTFEPELGDIGPKTYDRVCELILRLRGNMLAPAMHTCTGAFYSHPESQRVASRWGIMITTSHCEPLLFNNAAPLRMGPTARRRVELRDQW